MSLFLESVEFNGYLLWAKYWKVSLGSGTSEYFDCLVLASPSCSKSACSYIERKWSYLVECALEILMWRHWGYNVVLFTWPKAKLAPSFNLKMFEQVLMYGV